MSGYYERSLVFMGYYFEDFKSIYAYDGTDVKSVIASIAARFMGQNTEHKHYFRAYTNKGIVRAADYRYCADLNKIFPESKQKDCVWAFTKAWAENGMVYTWDVNCFGPMEIYVNGEQVFKSDLFTERYSDTATRISFKLAPGWNDIRFRWKKTKAGFGGQFGTWLAKWALYTFMPSKERDGQEGFLFTGLVDDQYEPQFELGMSEADFDGKLYPDVSFPADGKGQLSHMFGEPVGKYSVAWTKGFFPEPGTKPYKFTLSAKGRTCVYIDRVKVFETDGGDAEFTVDAKLGEHDIFVKSVCGGDWGFDLAVDGVKLRSAAIVKGTDDVWMYIGPFEADYEFPFEKACDMNHVVGEPKTYWRLNAADTFVRPYNENSLFGRWNYPLGVTLYGMLHAAYLLDSNDIKKYLKDHVQLCCDTLEYALWDKEQYGGATAVHNLLTSIDSLDDCGSFASTMLEVHKYMPIDNVKYVADYVADFISNEMSRLDDGTFFRKNLMHSFHNDTLWADDLYMSVPFLTRYYKFTGDIKYANDAAEQFFGFRKKLFMEDQHIMSHVYDFKYDSMTGVPWGRGNGWVVFSMTELLAELPEDHSRYHDLVDFLNELCSAYVKLQDPDGMWHQIITDWESYPETSCTSMFMYAFSRGVRYGWLKDPDKYIKAVYKGWEAITRTSVDCDGNVYGVCRGSEFSFIPDYYKYELGWNLNDTHGTGIVLLAGIETEKLTEFLGK